MQSYFIITPILFCGKSNLMIVEMIIDEKKYTTERYAKRSLVGREKILDCQVWFWTERTSLEY